MTDLDKQVAEVQGWTWDSEDLGWWYHGKRVCLIEEWHPSTDLNQAVAFAEWALPQTAFRIQCEFDGLRSPDEQFWRVSLYKRPSVLMWWTATKDEHFAEALCLAVLKALGERSA